MSEPAAVPSFRQKTFLGHPVGLTILFFTEMWERFSYYGMRALLVLYMVNYLFLKPDLRDSVIGLPTLKHVLESMMGPLSNQALSSEIYGLYTALVYLTPFFGGIIADRVLGQRKTVVVGGLLMALGHFLMASERLFLVAMLFLMVGNGAFKPNISTQVGSLYPPDDPRIDRAFNIFYFGVNVGSFFSPLICGTLQVLYGYHYGFGAAGVGMLLGLALYLHGQKYLAPDNLTRSKVAHKKAEPLTPDEKRVVWALCGLCVLNIVFWGVYEQQGNTMQLWADENTNWLLHIGSHHWNVPSTWFQSFNPFFIFLLTPVLNWLWTRQAKKGTEPSSVIKMAIGCFVLGLSYVVMIIGARVIGGGRGSVAWLAVTTLILTLGELYLSPIGLSLVSKVSPPRIVSMMMGMWYLSSFAGNYLSGYIGVYYERMPKTDFFLLLCVLGVGAGAAIWAFNRPLHKAFGRTV